MLTMTSREFNQDASQAKRAAMNGPVFITDRGKPAHVLMNIDDFNKLTTQTNIVDLLACPTAENSAFDPQPLQSNLLKIAEL